MNSVDHSTVRVAGTPASTGLARGPLFFLGEDPDPQGYQGSGALDVERARLLEALETSKAELGNLLEGLEDGDEAEGILEFQLAMLEDESFTDPAYAAIKDGVNALDAWSSVLENEISDYESAEDEYFRGRASDLRDIRDRICNTLLGRCEQQVPCGSIVVAKDLSPTRFLTISWGDGGVVLLGGSRSSHVAMLARARNVPMVVGLGAAPPRTSEEVFLDAESGELILEADAAERHRLTIRMMRLDERRRTEAGYLLKPATTSSGESVQVQLNISEPGELAGLNPDSCDGIGLVRTEFLFYASAGLPSEDTQYRAYRQIVSWAAGKPVTIRTLDAGGDKPVPGLTVDGELNPFLGLRGIRVSLARPEVFRIQLRAILRASHLGPVKIMLPMVSVPRELEEARSLLEQERLSLAQAGTETGNPKLGIMVEVPSTAITIDQFDADFFSIGSNDLSQYTLAASRDSEQLETLLGAGDLAVARLIERVVADCRRRHREVSLCGEMAMDERYISRLLEIGLRYLSVPPGALAKTKYAIAHAVSPDAD